MTLPSSGAISLNQMHVEAGGSSGSQVSMGDTDIRDMVLAPSFTQNSFSTYYGAKRAFVLSVYVGYGNINNIATQYSPASTTRTRGYNDGEFSNRTPSTYGTIGNVNSQSNSNCRNTDYFNNNRVCYADGSALSTTATSTHTTATVRLAVSDSQTGGTLAPNSAVSFQRVSVNTTVFARSAATFSYNSGAVNGDVQWVWTHTFSPAQSFTNDTVAIPPFTATGTSTKITIAAV